MWAEESGLRRGGRGDLGGEIIILGAQHRQKTPPALQHRATPHPAQSQRRMTSWISPSPFSDAHTWHYWHSPNVLPERPACPPHWRSAAVCEPLHVANSSHHCIAYPATRPRRRQFSLLLGSSFVVIANP